MFSRYFQIANRMDKALTPPEELLKLYEHQKQLRQAKSSPAKSSSNPLTSSTPTPTETADGGSSRGRSIQRVRLEAFLRVSLSVFGGLFVCLHM